MKEHKVDAHHVWSWLKIRIGETSIVSEWADGEHLRNHSLQNPNN